jgi:hypothetical protein
MSISDCVAAGIAGAEQRANMIQKRDDSTPSPPPLDLVDDSNITEGHASDDIIDLKAVLACVESPRNIFAPNVGLRSSG